MRIQFILEAYVYKRRLQILYGLSLWARLARLQFYVTTAITRKIFQSKFSFNGK